jgi:pimeloyl-ACP methyl ester carboxylesterase
MGAMREGQAWTPPATRELTAGGGRVLRYCCYGPADGLPVVSLAGTPGTRWERPDVITAFERAALRVAAPDRPGYGGSTRQPGRTVADVAADVRTAGRGSRSPVSPAAARTRWPAPRCWPGG